MTFIIEIIDGIYAKAPKPLIPYIAPLLRYDREVATQAQFGTSIKRRDAYYIDRRNGKFLYGFIDRVCGNLTDRHIMWSITGNYPNPLRAQTPAKLDGGIKLRPDQLQLIKQTLIYQRGVIKAPTGSGKTITALGLISMFPGMRVLILVHRQEILKQFIERFKKHLPIRKLTVVTEGQTPPPGGTVVGMIQTAIKYPVDVVCDAFDIVIVDEVHRCWDRDGQYGTFLNYCLAPMKIGFTATPWNWDTHRERALGTEGLIGPIIGELTLQKGQDLGIVAKPYITLRTVPYDPNLGDLRRYREIYDRCVVNNRARNAIISKEAKIRALAGKSTLTIVREIKHGEILANMAQTMGLNSVFIHGSTPGEQRDAVKQALENKIHMNVIATDIWKEGVDIPSLNGVIIAAAPKSQIYTLQAVGRGMRTAEGKTRVEIIDFLDPYRYLARHAIQRLSTYVEEGWL